MCLFLEMLQVKKCHNLNGGGYFPVTVNNFHVPKFWHYHFDISSLSGICENITDDEINFDLSPKKNKKLQLFHYFISV